MKIKEINIASFGGIKNLKITPDSGFNVIYGNNEQGKSTVMSFIKMMFYGNGRNSSDIAKNIRKKYTPWYGSVMAGSIDFEHSGRNYRIEREFKKSDSSDRVTLIDLDLGTRSIAEPDIGRKFFGLTSAAFERSVFIGQFGFPEGDPEGEIGKRLSNIALTGEETVSFDTVFSRLTKAKNALMSKSGTAGIYDKNLKQIEVLKQRLAESNEAHETYQAVKERLKTAKSEILKMQARADELKQKISAEQDIRNAAKLKELLNLKASLDRLNRSLSLNDGGIADETYVKKLQFCLNKTDAADSKIKSALREIEILENSISISENSSKEEQEAQKAELTQKIAACEEERRQIGATLKTLEREESRLLIKLSTPQSFKKKCNPVLLIIGSLVLLLGIVLAVIPLIYPALVLGVIGIILSIFGFVIKPMDTKALEECKIETENIRSEISETEFNLSNKTAEISVMKARLETTLTALSGNKELLEKNKKILSDTKANLTLLKEEYESEKEQLFSLFARYKKESSLDDIKSAIEEISLGAQKQKELKQQINYILKDVGNISYEQAAEKIERIEKSTDLSADFDEIKAEYESLLSRITDAKTTAASAAARAEEALSTAGNPEDLKKQINELTTRCKSQKDYCDRLSIALEVLSDSNIEVRRSFGSELEKNAAKIFFELTNGKYSQMTVSKNLEITVTEADKFGSREAEYLSSGTADQTYLSLRLAISALMASDGENLPILMDDALAQYDDERTLTALKFLKNYAENNQIILFTCHNSVLKEATNIGAKEIRI